MLEFHLDSRSGVPAYLQLVRQVEHAARLGFLAEGEQLPSVREVSAALVINPNTVLKAYRELEHRGLAAARAGQGMFVTRAPEGVPIAGDGGTAPGRYRLGAQGVCGRARAGWRGGARRADRARAGRGGRGVSAALEASQLGRRYGGTWALRECSLSVAPGRVAALAGPNGAGKSTLIQLAAGLLAPTCGSVRVFGADPRRGGPPALARIGYLAQDHPLYARFSVADLLRMGRALNVRWDDAAARRRLEGLGIPLRQRAGTLSGGQQAQVALALALAKRPELLILDEPVASLDPLARREFMSGLMDAVAAEGLTVLLSSHVVSELEQVCDYLIVLSREGRRSPVIPRRCWPGIAG